MVDIRGCSRGLALTCPVFILFINGPVSYPVFSEPARFFFFSLTDFKYHSLSLHLEHPCLLEFPINNLNVVVKIHASCFSFLLPIQYNYICKLQGDKVPLSFLYSVSFSFQKLPDSLPRSISDCAKYYSSSFLQKHFKVFQWSYRLLL